MSLRCPVCQSDHVISKDLAQQALSFAGTVGGAASGATGAIAGAEIGSTLGNIGGPVGRGLGAVAGAAVGALLGALTGHLTGSRIGRVVDRYLLDNLQCLDCGCSFSADCADPLPPLTVSISTPAVTPEAPAAESLHAEAQAQP